MIKGKREDKGEGWSRSGKRVGSRKMTVEAKVKEELLTDENKEVLVEGKNNKAKGKRE